MKLLCTKLSLALLCLIFIGCKKDDPSPDNAIVGLWKYHRTTRAILQNGGELEEVDDSVFAPNKDHTYYLTLDVKSDSTVLVTYNNGLTYTGSWNWNKDKFNLSEYKTLTIDKNQTNSKKLALIDLVTGFSFSPPSQIYYNYRIYFQRP